MIIKAVAIVASYVVVFFVGAYVHKANTAKGDRLLDELARLAKNGSASAWEQISSHLLKHADTLPKE